MHYSRLLTDWRTLLPHPAGPVYVDKECYVVDNELKMARARDGLYMTLDPA